jgi:hypothetical protein
LIALVVTEVQDFQLMEGVDARVQGKEVTEHRAEQIEIAFAEKRRGLELEDGLESPFG